MHYNTAASDAWSAGGCTREIVDRVPNLVATKTMTADLSVVPGRPRRT